MGCAQNPTLRHVNLDTQTPKTRHSDIQDPTLARSKSDTWRSDLRNLPLGHSKHAAHPITQKPARTYAERDDQTLITQRSEIQNTTPRHTKAKAQTLNTQCPDIRDATARILKASTQTLKAQCSDVLKPTKN